MFDYDWFNGGGLQSLVDEAKRRCAVKKYPGEDGGLTDEQLGYMDQLDTRIILHLKDGLTYELSELADVGMHAALAFECVPVDENYKVGAIVIVVPFEDVARVEVFAVHPDERPMETLRIPGFRAGSVGGEAPQ